MEAKRDRRTRGAVVRVVDHVTTRPCQRQGKPLTFMLCDRLEGTGVGCGSALLTKNTLEATEEELISRDQFLVRPTLQPGLPDTTLVEASSNQAPSETPSTTRAVPSRVYKDLTVRKHKQ